ncbi:hypothetical protein PMEGAS228_52660 [Priestia megaterium]
MYFSSYYKYFCTNEMSRYAAHFFLFGSAFSEEFERSFTREHIWNSISFFTNDSCDMIKQ